MHAATTALASKDVAKHAQQLMQYTYHGCHVCEVNLVICFQPMLSASQLCAACRGQVRLSPTLRFPYCNMLHEQHLLSKGKRPPTVLVSMDLAQFAQRMQRHSCVLSTLR